MGGWTDEWLVGLGQKHVFMYAWMRLDDWVNVDVSMLDIFSFWKLPGFVEHMDSASYPGIPAVYDAWQGVVVSSNSFRDRKLV